MSKASSIISECLHHQDFKTPWEIFQSGSQFWECADGGGLEGVGL